MRPPTSSRLRQYLKKNLSYLSASIRLSERNDVVILLSVHNYIRQAIRSFGTCIHTGYINFDITLYLRIHNYRLLAVDEIAVMFQTVTVIPRSIIAILWYYCIESNILDAHLFNNFTYVCNKRCEFYQIYSCLIIFFPIIFVSWSLLTIASSKSLTLSYRL